jgi:hypothetical protein
LIVISGSERAMHSGLITDSVIMTDNLATVPFHGDRPGYLNAATAYLSGSPIACIAAVSSLFGGGGDSTSEQLSNILKQLSAIHATLNISVEESESDRPPPTPASANPRKHPPGGNGKYCLSLGPLTSASSKHAISADLRREFGGNSSFRILRASVR